MTETDSGSDADEQVGGSNRSFEDEDEDDPSSSAESADRSSLGRRAFEGQNFEAIRKTSTRRFSARFSGESFATFGLFGP